MSTLSNGALSFSAFSGMKSHINQKGSVCLPNFGAIPPGRYYIFDRQSGGLLGPIRDFFGSSDKSTWFSLFADDGTIDDETICDEMKRGNFRLHPKGSRGISMGCITLENLSDFNMVSSILKRSPLIDVKGTSLKAYGIVVVS